MNIFLLIIGIANILFAGIQIRSPGKLDVVENERFEYIIEVDTQDCPVVDYFFDKQLNPSWTQFSGKKIIGVPPQNLVDSTDTISITACCLNGFMDQAKDCEDRMKASKKIILNIELYDDPVSVYFRGDTIIKYDISSTEFDIRLYDIDYEGPNISNSKAIWISHNDTIITHDILHGGYMELSFLWRRRHLIEYVDTLKLIVPDFDSTLILKKIIVEGPTRILKPEGKPKRTPTVNYDVMGRRKMNNLNRLIWFQK